MSVDDLARVLLERDDDVVELESALGEVLDGDGRLVMIEGPAGIGKSVLLDEVRTRARHRGFTVAMARAGELETGYGFGVVRQLFEPLLFACSEDERAQLLSGAARLAEPVFDVDPDASDTNEVGFARLHGLHWLAANLAERAPLLLAVDDAQWADEPSLRFLDHLARRVAGLPVLIALTGRTGVEADRPLLRALGLQARPPILRPRPLGAAAVRTLVRARLDPDAGDDLCRACLDACGGNPFLLTELLMELRMEARSRGTPSATAVRELGPSRVAVAVLMRVGRLDPDAPALSRAVAVLGEQVSLAAAARLARLDRSRATALADALAEQGILEPGDPPRFVHPLVRAAIYRDMPAARRDELHRRAALQLAEDGAAPESVAMHLLATRPCGDQDVVRALRAAAHRATASGALDAALTLLERALAEPPDIGLRPRVVYELGDAERLCRLPAAAEHLREAYDTAESPQLRARALMALGFHTWFTAPAGLKGLVESFELAAADVTACDDQLALELHVMRLGALQVNPDLPVRLEEEVERFRDLPVRTRAEIGIHSFLARRVMADGQVSRAADLAERLATHNAELGGPGWACANATMCLVAAERYDVAERVLSRILRGAERRGEPINIAGASWQRAFVRHRRGDLPGAEADGGGAVSPGGGPAFPLVDALTDQGKFAEAEEVVDRRDLAREPHAVVTSIWPLISRGRLRAVTGDLASARHDLTEALRRLEISRGLLAGEHDARVALVPVLLGLGDSEAAEALATEALAAARASGIVRAIGGALRVAGLVRGGTAGRALLREAAETLAASPSLLWRAEALVDYGAALRRDGLRTEARDALRDGMDLAHRCAAHPLADRAADELRGLGTRIHRKATTGAAALTASERRVAELAAEGQSNKQIAQALFVTLRTVETHLSNSYLKLQISSREGLARALAG